MPPTVHLIDASPYVFRAFFSLPASLVDTGGRPVNAVYGFAGFLLKYLAEQAPTHAAACFDESLNTSFRNETYPEYKAQRELPPAELEAQLRDCQAVAQAFGIATFADDRFEADDWIATLLHRARSEDPEVDAVVVSSDKDLAQLVDDRVSFFDFAKGERFDTEAVIAKFGVRPQQIPDFLGLAGDAVDNIPGVPKVGKQTAAALLGAFADLDALYAGLERVATLELRGARTLAARLEEHRDLAFLSRDLARLSTEAPLDTSLEALTLHGADRSLVEPLFERLGFERMLARVGPWR